MSARELAQRAVIVFEVLVAFIVVDWIVAAVLGGLVGFLITLVLLAITCVVVWRMRGQGWMVNERVLRFSKRALSVLGGVGFLFALLALSLWASTLPGNWPGVIYVAEAITILGLIIWEIRGWFRWLIGLVAVIGVLAVPAQALAWSAGGVNYGPSGSFRTHTWADTWKVGHVPNPFDTVAYKTHLYADVQFGWDYQIDSVYKYVYVNDESIFTANHGLVQASNNIYDCKVDGRLRNNACYTGYRKWHLSINYKAYTIQCYPWVRLRISSKPDTPGVWWDYGSNNGTFC